MLATAAKQQHLHAAAACPASSATNNQHVSSSKILRDSNEKTVLVHNLPAPKSFCTPPQAQPHPVLSSAGTSEYAAAACRSAPQHGPPQGQPRQDASRIDNKITCHCEEALADEAI